MFSRYVIVGVANTAIHWAIFFIFFQLLEQDQSVSNLIAFIAAVTFSFFVNARFTFRSTISSMRYLLYVGFLGLMSFLFGRLADVFDLPAILTLVSFSAFSLLFGFLFSKYVVFRKRSS
ncbi:GtrA family protein [Rhizobium sp. CG5]|uniref:GtrA family protein n=1 Tax=Rhizobium sp. CG5 TaxID=2726076 RepID=UPI002033FA7F|nr:GtrA family protein [Rhizobium sp. CG5]MCM2472782.1 GtrA family protein [Rhizobium sp. CG5]